MGERCGCSRLLNLGQVYRVLKGESSAGSAQHDLFDHHTRSPYHVEGRAVAGRIGGEVAFVADTISIGPRSGFPEFRQGQGN